MTDGIMTPLDRFVRARFASHRQIAASGGNGELAEPTRSPLGKDADKGEPILMIESPQPLSTDDALGFGDDEPVSDYLFEPNGSNADTSLKPSSISASKTNRISATEDANSKPEEGD